MTTPDPLKSLPPEVREALEWGRSLLPHLHRCDLFGCDPAALPEPSPQEQAEPPKKVWVMTSENEGYWAEPPKEKP
jgi:hypothetical protein